MKYYQKYIVAVMLLFAVGAVAACQPTPEELIVQNKNKEELLNAIENEAQSNAADESLLMDTQQTASEQDEASNHDANNSLVIQPLINYGDSETVTAAHWEHSTELYGGKVVLNIDADVMIPSIQQLPVVCVAPRSFSLEDINHIIDTLIGDSPMYEYVYGATKDDIHEAIIKTKMQMTDMDSDLAQSTGAKSLSELEAIGSSQIEALEAMLKDAPESIERIEIDRDNLRFSNVPIQADLGKDDMAELSIINNTVMFENTGFLDDNCFYFLFGRASEANNHTGITSQQAGAIASEMIASLNIDDMAVTRVECGYITNGHSTKTPCYKVSITRLVNGIVMPNILSNDSSMESETSPNIPIDQEEMTVYINESGIVRFVWKTPMEVTEVINKNVELLSFDDIKDSFIQQFKNKYSFYENSSDDSRVIEYNITEIALNLARVKMPDEQNKYMLIPVWDFFGEKHEKITDTERIEMLKELQTIRGEYGSQVGNKQSYLNEEDIYVEQFIDTTYLTINAITGASINRNMGY